MTTVLWGEVRRTFHWARSYWVEYLSNFVLYLFGFLLLVVMFRSATDGFGQDGILSTLLGYITWYMCASVMSSIAHVAEDESRTGTLEQLFLTGLSPQVVFLTRSAGRILLEITQGVPLALFLAIFLGVLRPVPLLAILVFILTLLGACGLGFALAGITMVTKRAEGLIRTIWQMLVFFSGALAPMHPPALAFVARILPLGLGIENLRMIFLEDATLSSLWQNGLLPGLLINTLAYILVGLALFTWGERRARRNGTLAHY
jgi:ABC-2 type transport system permease protein